MEATREGAWAASGAAGGSGSGLDELSLDAVREAALPDDRGEILAPLVLPLALLDDLVTGITLTLAT
jgi:hypothetical protein